MDKAVIPLRKIKKAFADVYDVYSFIMRFFKEPFLPPYEFKEIVR